MRCIMAVCRFKFADPGNDRSGSGRNGMLHITDDLADSHGLVCHAYNKSEEQAVGDNDYYWCA